MYFLLLLFLHNWLSYSTDFLGMGAVEMVRAKLCSLFRTEAVKSGYASGHEAKQDN